MMRILQRDKCSAGPANLDRSDVCGIWGVHTSYKDKLDHILMATLPSKKILYRPMYLIMTMVEKVKVQ